ncbi:MAG: hypothetical protein EBW49_07280 [Betaproteobacteria bacterium]|nr:hypothetical protein [Betaproteobacteria bacterium]NDG15246.1 hypothetical protein [Betaproteobacteria bacterium]
MSSPDLIHSATGAVQDENTCTLCLARWPLPALADGCALHATRTKVLLQSAQKTLDNGLMKRLSGAL